MKMKNAKVQLLNSSGACLASVSIGTDEQGYIDNQRLSAFVREQSLFVGDTIHIVELEQQPREDK